MRSKTSAMAMPLAAVAPLQATIGPTQLRSVIYSTPNAYSWPRLKPGAMPEGSYDTDGEFAESWLPSPQPVADEMRSADVLAHITHTPHLI